MDRILKSILSETERGREWLRQEAAAKRAKSARRSSRSPRAPGVDRAAKREERNARMAQIRARVAARAAGKCEACDAAIGDDFHAHHVIGGGLRQSRESERTVAAVCARCHDSIHRGEMTALWGLRCWANVWGFGEAHTAIERRIEKLAEARSAARREEETTP